MKLDWLRADIASARRASALLVLLLVGSMLANVTLAAFAMHMAGRERVVVVPPSINKTFWVESERVSAEYLEQMAYFLLQLTLNVTPQSIDHQSRVLLQYAAPASYGELRSVLATAAERVKRDGASTVFSAQDLAVDREAPYGRHLLLQEPLSDDGRKGPGIEVHQHPSKGGLAWSPQLTVFIGEASQGAQLTRVELRAGVLVGTISAGTHEGGNRGASEDEALAMIEAVTFAGVGELAETIQKVVQGGSLKGAWA